MQKEINNVATELHNYFEALAQSSTLIGYDGTNGYFRSMGIEQLVQTTNLAFGNTFGLVLEMIDGKVTGKNRNDASVGAAVGLWFLSFAPKDDHEKVQEVQNAAFTIGTQFLAKIKKDQEAIYDEGDIELSIVHYFDLNSIDFDVAGPVGDQLHGYRFEFMLRQEGRLVFDESKWV